MKSQIHHERIKSRSPQIHEQHRGGRLDTAIQWLLDFLNLDFHSVHGTQEATLFLANRSFPPDDPEIARRFQDRLTHLLAPILISDLHQVAEQRRAVLKGMIRMSRQRGRPQDEINNLHRMSERLRHLSRAQLQQERGNGLRLLAQLLTEWAEKSAVRPQWQLDPVNVKQAAEKIYNVGSNKFVVRKWDRIQDGIWNTGMTTLAACLEGGQLNRLRNCVLCSRFFYAYHFRKKFCCPQHQREYDDKKAALRAHRWRKKQEAQLKRDALAILSTLSQQVLRMPRVEKMLSESQLGALSEMLLKIEARVSKKKIWAQASPRERALFKKLRSVGVQ